MTFFLSEKTRKRLLRLMDLEGAERQAELDRIYEEEKDNKTLNQGEKDESTASNPASIS